MVEVCDNLSSVHGVLMHENLAIHEMVKEEEQRLVAEEQKALTEETKEHTEKQKTPPGEQKMDPGEQKEHTEEHKLPAGDQMETTEKQEKLTVERKEHTGEQTLTEQTMPNEVKMEHPDECITPTEKVTSVEKEIPSEEQKVSIEEQHSTTEEQKTPREGEEALKEGEREEAQKKKVVEMRVALSIHEQHVTHATAGTDELDSKETNAKEGPERQEQKVNQPEQEMEVIDCHSQLDQWSADADRTVDQEQEQHEVETDGVPPRVEVENFEEPAAVVESDVPVEPELDGSEQLHSSPTDEESGQAKPSESTSSWEVWDDGSCDASAGTEGHEVEESVDGDIRGQSGVGDGGRKGEETVLESIRAEQEEDMVSRGINQFQQEGPTGAISVDAQVETAEDSRVGTTGGYRRGRGC